MRAQSELDWEQIFKNSLLFLNFKMTNHEDKHLQAGKAKERTDLHVRIESAIFPRARSGQKSPEYYWRPIFFKTWCNF